MRQCCGANMLPKRHQQSVYLDPLRARHEFFQHLQCFFGLCGLHQTPAVHHAMHVNIHTDGGLPGCHAEGEVGAFRPHTSDSHFELPSIKNTIFDT